MVGFRRAAEIQHVPREELRAQPVVHRGLHRGEDLLHPQWERPHRQAELYPRIRVRPVRVRRGAVDIAHCATVEKGCVIGQM